MHNLYVSRRRREKRPLAGQEPVENAGLRVEGEQEVRLQAADVMEAVARLPEDLRSVLLLVTVEDLAYAEVAKILGLPIGTVMSRLSRARERLRRDCQEPTTDIARVK